MTREELMTALAELKSRGYKRNFKDEELPRILAESKHSSHYYYKVIERRKDKWGDSRAINQLFFKIWSLEAYRDRLNTDSLYSLEPVVCVSRNIDERVDLSLSFPDRDIDECEQIAEKFGKWVDENVKEYIDEQDNERGE